MGFLQQAVNNADEKPYAKRDNKKKVIEIYLLKGDN